MTATAQETMEVEVTPARALARLMVATLVAVVLTLVLLVGTVGVAKPIEPGGTTVATAGP